MKTLYIDCAMGAAGDMLTAALFELCGEEYLQKLNALGIPGVEFRAEKCRRGGIMGTHISVLIGGGEEHEDHAHAHLHHIEDVIRSLNVSESVKENALGVYKLIAEAESHVHGESVEHVHFHEVGAMDAIADVTAVCFLMEELGADKIIASPVHVGSGTVRCAHGVLSVPAPATEYLLRDVPTYGGEIKTELCTPTGAALLRRFADSFGSMPEMSVLKTGYGMGRKDFPEAPNCVRIMLGDSGEKADDVIELACNIDDMTPEALAFAAEKIMSLGALDVWTSPIVMKKGRSGFLFTVLCAPKDEDLMAGAIFRYTSTIGIRKNLCRRHTLSRREFVKETALGPVNFKEVSGYGVKREKAEYEDLRRLAEEHGLSIDEIRKML